MKAVWKKLIAVAFCAATAASMLSVGVSAAGNFWDTIEYAQKARTYVDDRYVLDNYRNNREIVVNMRADNYNTGSVTVSVDVPYWITATNIKYDWTGSDKLSGLQDGDDKTATIKVGAEGGNFTAVCKVTVSCQCIRNGKTVTWDEEITVSLRNKWAYSNKDNADASKDKPYYDTNLPHWNDYHDWDDWYDDWKDQVDDWWWGNDGYYVVINGHKYWVDGDWRPSYRPSYSKEYEVDWHEDTYYYNGKVQMPTATVTIGNKTIDLDVKLISGDGTSVGRHRVRASLPTRYRNYDITGTTLYYEIEEAQKEGFVTEGGKTYYYDNGRKVTGWQTIKGSDYYFLDNGEAADGWVKDGPADWYYFDEGKMVTGWINDGGTTYYCYNSGKMCHGRWHEIGNKWYYFNASGAMATSQWILDKGKWYYVAGDGVMATNTTVPGGYKVDKNGVWVK